MRRFAASLALIILTPVAFALDETDRSAARATIERQIEAFRKDDAATAYAQAAPQIQNMFSSPTAFIEMVERGYKPVLRPRSYRFDTAHDTGSDEIAQGVQLQDADGEDWIAVYALQKQSDGQWRITGCSLKKAPGDRA